jgi:hypothetical protein
MAELSQALGALVLLFAGMAMGWLWQRSRKPAAPAAPALYSQLTELRAIGELSVFKAVSKDLLTQVDHSFGEFGRKYLSWAFTKKKLAMVFEFEMDFRYDLRSELMRIETEPADASGQKRVFVVLPPCRVDVSIRSLSFYDEQRARFLPWLLPDLVQGFFDGRFSEEDKNRLIASAKEHAAAQAAMLAERYQPAVERSALLTLQALTRPLGYAETRIQFAAQSQVGAVEASAALRLAD